jgi:lactate racemase
MKYLTYSGNDLIHAGLPDTATIYYPPPLIAGRKSSEIPASIRRAFENPLGMPPLRDQVKANCRILIAFDDNCQPFPLMKKPDFRQIAIETLLEMLYSYGVSKENIQLMCAVALHRKMKPHELEYMLGKKIMREFYPRQLKNFDAEDSDDIVDLGETEQGEAVETTRAVIESDLVIYIDCIQIPLNGGHKSVAVGFGTYRSLAHHHSPQMTAETPHVMQPEGSLMHASITRISRVIERHSKIMVLEAPMNGATYPPYLSFIAKSPQRCNPLEKGLRALTPGSMKLLPESVRRHLFRNIRSPYSPLDINAGAIDAVHERTLKVLRPQLEVTAPRQFDTLVFGLADLSPYAVDARINPVLVLSDVLGYVFNWFYNKPFLKKGGVVIILNPVYEIFHEEYHVAYHKFWDEVLPETTDPFQMQEQFQDRFARDSHLIDCYRNRYAHHGFHPFTVWYWATYPLKYLSQVILVGPHNDKMAKRLGVSFSPSLDHALARAKEITAGDDVVALSLPPFLYLNVQD